MKMDSRVKAVERIASAWNREGIVYAVAHGIEQYPDELGRDIDVFVQRRHLEKARRLAIAILRDYFEVVIAPEWDVWPLRQIFAFGEENSLQIDLFTALLWGPVALVEDVNPVATVHGLFKIDPWANFAKNVLLKILGGIQPLSFTWTSEYEEVVLRRCEVLFGKDYAKKIIEVLQKGNLIEGKPLISEFRKAVILRSFIRHPLKSFFNSLCWPIKKARLYFFRRFPSMAVIGLTDRIVNEITESEFAKSLCFTEAIIKRPLCSRQGTGISSLLFSAVTMTLQAIRNWMQDNYAVNSMKLVIYDGHDWSCGQNTYKKLGSGIKPDVIVLLDEGYCAAVPTEWEKARVSIEVIDGKMDARNVAREIRKIFIKKIAAKYGVDITNG